MACMFEMQGESSAMDIVDEDMGLECSSTADHSLVDILGAPFEVFVLKDKY